MILQTKISNFFFLKEVQSCFCSSSVGEGGKERGKKKGGQEKSTGTFMLNHVQKICWRGYFRKERNGTEPIRGTEIEGFMCFLINVFFSNLSSYKSILIINLLSKLCMRLYI